MHASILVLSALPLTILAFDTSLSISSLTSFPPSEFHTVLPSITISNSIVTSLPTSTPSTSVNSKPSQTFLSFSLGFINRKLPDRPSINAHPLDSMHGNHDDSSQRYSTGALQAIETNCRFSDGMMATLKNDDLWKNSPSENRSLPDTNSSVSSASASATSAGIFTIISSNGGSEGTNPASEDASLWIFGFLGIVLAGSALVGLTGAAPSESVGEE